MMPLTLMLVKSGDRVAGQAAEEFGKMDPTGIAMIMIAMAVVFSSLIFLFLTFKYIAKLYNLDIKKLFSRRRENMQISDEEQEISGDTLAAIALALHLYHQQMQGLEDAVITFRKAAKIYSPWSSKIYGMRKTPNR